MYAGSSSMTDVSAIQLQLIKAIKLGDNLTIEHLTRIKHVNPNFKTKHGQTPIELAANRQCNTLSLRLLLEAGADPNRAGLRLILEHSICNKDLEAVKLLVKSGARFTWQAGRGILPLHLSINNEAFEITKFFLDAKANVNACNLFGHTTIHLCALKSSVPPKVFDMLIDAGTYIDVKDNEGYTPLHTAVVERNIGCVVKLLERGANTLVGTSEKGDTALHLACRYVCLEVMQLLIKVGVPIDCQNKMKQTPLHLVTFDSNRDLVFYLVKAGANVNAMDINGERPIDVAVSNKDIESINILLTAGSIVSKECCISFSFVENQVSDSNQSNSFGAYIEYLSNRPQSLKDICVLSIRKTLAPHFLRNPYLDLPIPSSFQKEIGLEALVLDDDLSDLSKFHL